MSTKLASLDRAQANTLIHHFLDQFKECCNNSAPLNVADLDKYLVTSLRRKGKDGIMFFFKSGDLKHGRT